MATTSTYRLPVTGREVPAEFAEYTVTSLKQIQTHDGVALTATLRRNGKIVGTLEDQGYGGGINFYGRSVDYERDFNEAIGHIGIVTTDAPFDSPEWARWFYLHTPDGILEALISEYELARELKRHAKTSTVIGFGDPPDPDTVKIYKTADTDLAVRTARKNHPDEPVVQVFVDGAWKEVG